VGEWGSRIRVEREGRVLRLVLVRPERGNAIDPEFVDEFRAAVSQLEESVGCIAIVAEGETFCVGGDVRVFAEAPEPGTSVYLHPICAAQQCGIANKNIWSVLRIPADHTCGV
jgi:enoyl-CoA hydratase/carnithine racemase